MKLTIAALAIAALPLVALGQGYTTGSTHQYYVALIPNTPTVAVVGTVYLRGVTLVNKTDATVTVTITDRGTDCGGAACEFTSTVSIAARTTYTIPFDDQVAPSGISWSASAATSIVGRIHYRTALREP